MFERFKDSNKFSFNKDNITRFTPNNPCDGFFFYKGILTYVELKSTHGNITFNQPIEVQEKGKAKPMIKTSQVLDLLKRSKYKDVVCGLIIRFENIDKKTEISNPYIGFVEINDFVKWTKKCNKKSMNVNEFKQISLKIEYKQPKVSYIYNLEKMLETIKKANDIKVLRMLNKNIDNK